MIANVLIGKKMQQRLYRLSFSGCRRSGCWRV